MMLTILKPMIPITEHHKIIVTYPTLKTAPQSENELLVHFLKSALKQKM